LEPHKPKNVIKVMVLKPPDTKTLIKIMVSRPPGFQTFVKLRRERGEAKTRGGRPGKSNTYQKLLFIKEIHTRSLFL